MELSADSIYYAPGQHPPHPVQSRAECHNGQQVSEQVHHGCVRSEDECPPPPSDPDGGEHDEASGEGQAKCNLHSSLGASSSPSPQLIGHPSADSRREAVGGHEGEVPCVTQMEMAESGSWVGLQVSRQDGVALEPPRLHAGHEGRGQRQAHKWAKVVQCSAVPPLPGGTTGARQADIGNEEEEVEAVGH